MKKEVKILKLESKKEGKSKEIGFDVLKAFQKEFQIIENMFPEKLKDKSKSND